MNQIEQCVEKANRVIDHFKAKIVSDEDIFQIPFTEFIEKYSLRFKKVVDSCRNELELETAENYIRCGLKTYAPNANPLMADEYVRILIRPKQIEIMSGGEYIN